MDKQRPVRANSNVKTTKGKMPPTFSLVAQRDVSPGEQVSTLVQTIVMTMSTLMQTVVDASEGGITGRFYHGLACAPIFFL